MLVDSSRGGSCFRRDELRGGPWSVQPDSDYLTYANREVGRRRGQRRGKRWRL